MVIVGLPTVNDFTIRVNKHDYTTPYNDCQLEQEKNTLEYNYITTEEFIQNNHKKYQDIIP